MNLAMNAEQAMEDADRKQLTVRTRAITKGASLLVSDSDVGIVSDLRMPGISGDQLLTRLAALGTGLDRRVIFLTGDATSAHSARVLAASNTPVLHKPIELADLTARIARHAEGSGG